jgi:hypothetical protein
MHIARASKCSIDLGIEKQFLRKVLLFKGRLGNTTAKNSFQGMQFPARTSKASHWSPVILDISADRLLARLCRRLTAGSIEEYE